MPSNTRFSNNIEFIDGFLDGEAMKGLFRSSDVLLSLHRAEGFGIPMLEAMAQGVPVVATGWSGNMDFTNETNSILIPSVPIPVDDESVYFNYSASYWADPDESAAAEALRQLRINQDLLDHLAEQAWCFADKFANTWHIPELA